MSKVDELAEIIERNAGPRTRAGEWLDMKTWMRIGIGAQTAQYLAAASPALVMALVEVYRAAESHGYDECPCDDGEGCVMRTAIEKVEAALG